MHGQSDPVSLNQNRQHDRELEGVEWQSDAIALVKRMKWATRLEVSSSWLSAAL